MFILTKLCRLCTSDKNVLLTLNNSDDVDDITYLNKLNDIAPEILEVNSELPNGVCITCIAQLNEAYKFLKRCYKSQEILKKQLKLVQIKQIIERNGENSKSDPASFEFIKVEPLENELVDENEVKLTENNENTQINVIDLCSSEEESNDLPEESVDNYKKEEIDTTSCEFVDVANNSFEERILKVYPRSFETSTKSGSVNIDSYSAGGRIQTYISKNPFRCDVCAKTFRYKSCLIVHSRKHTNERPFKCQICGRAFTAMSSLNKHIRIHTNERPYVCKVCEKAFMGKSDLTRHFRIHTNEKPYRCRLCDKAFTQGCNLRGHMLNKHC